MVDYTEVWDEMDFNYHSKPSKERIVLHNSILSTLFRDIIPSVERKIIYTAGCFGSGKSHVLRTLSLRNYVHIDPDKLRFLLPEMKDYLCENSWTAGEKTQREVSYLAELAERYALRKGYNIVVDGSLHNVEWYLSHFQFIRSKYKYTISIIYVKTSWQNILERCWKRSEETRRCIPLSVLKSIYEKVPISMQILEKAVDDMKVIEN